MHGRLALRPRRIKASDKNNEPRARRAAHCQPAYLDRMSVAILHSRAISGMDAAPVTVEAHLANGLPSFTIVGTSRSHVL